MFNDTSNFVDYFLLKVFIKLSLCQGLFSAVVSMFNGISNFMGDVLVKVFFIKLSLCHDLFLAAVSLFNDISTFVGY